MDIDIAGFDEYDSIEINFDFIACRTCDQTKDDLLEYLNIEYPEFIIVYNNARLVQ